ALGPFLGGQCVADVVFPAPVDLEVAKSDTLAAQPELLGDPAARTVARDDRDLDPMKTDLFEGEPEQQHARLRHITTARLGLIDPVPDVGVLERSPRHRGDVHFACETAHGEDPESVAGAELPLAFSHRAPRDECCPVFGGMGRAGRSRLPGEQPVATTSAHLVPGLVVVLAKRAKPHPTAYELGRDPRSRQLGHVSSAMSAPRLITVAHGSIVAD